MKTYVTAKRGAHRGAVGWIAGTLEDKTRQCGPKAKAFVHWPGNKMGWLRVTSLRKLVETVEGTEIIPVIFELFP